MKNGIVPTKRRWIYHCLSSCSSLACLLKRWTHFSAFNSFPASQAAPIVAQTGTSPQYVSEKIERQKNTSPPANRAGCCFSRLGCSFNVRGVWWVSVSIVGVCWFALGLRGSLGARSKCDREALRLARR